jgi:hypothetical protein
MKLKIKNSAHVSQALGSDFKLSGIRPSKRSLRFEVQSEEWKKKSILQLI